MTLEGLHEDFRDLLVLLADAGVEFVIVGAYALAFHGAPRASEALIKNKEASGRLKDVADVARLRKTRPAAQG
jgi:hypothetical protein